MRMSHRSDYNELYRQRTLDNFQTPISSCRTGIMPRDCDYSDSLALPTTANQRIDNSYCTYRDNSMDKRQTVSVRSRGITPAGWNQLNDGVKTTQNSNCSNGGMRYRDDSRLLSNAVSMSNVSSQSYHPLYIDSTQISHPSYEMYKPNGSRYIEDTNVIQAGVQDDPRWSKSQKSVVGTDSASFTKSIPKTSSYPNSMDRLILSQPIKTVISSRREDFIRYNSSSDDSGYHDRPLYTLSGGFKDPLDFSADISSGSENSRLFTVPTNTAFSRLEAHELSISTPSTPVTPGPPGGPPGRKPLTSGTPNMIRRQLKTIAENFDQLRRPTGSTSSVTSPTHPPTRPFSAWSRSRQTSVEESTSESTCGDSTEGITEDVTDRRRATKARVRSKSLSRLGGSVGEETDEIISHKSDQTEAEASVTSDSLASRSESAAATAESGKTSSPSNRGRRMKKSKSLSGKLWLKMNGGKSAPCSPEPARKNTSKDKTNINRKSCMLDSGCVVTRTPTSLIQLTEPERLALQDIALDHLHKLNLGCSISLPKGNQSMRSFSSVRDLFQLVFNSGSGQIGRDNGSNQGKDQNLDESLTSIDSVSGVSGRRTLSFGIPLPVCVENDRLLGRRISGHAGSEWSCGRQSRINGTDLQDRRRGDSSVSVEALSLCGRDGVRGHMTRDRGEEDEEEDDLLVPYVVRCCCQYIQRYALHTTGIFRVGIVKSKTTELKAAFNSGTVVTLSDERNPHIMTSLLKDFFRELPDPLLTRDLYPAFIAVTDIAEREGQVKALRLLVSLLPPAHRDTLWYLLQFLNKVAQHSADKTDRRTGVQVSGNKMDAGNLALVFGPNLLHRCKAGKFQLESAEQVSQHTSVISVIKILVEEYSTVFQIPHELYAEMLEGLMEGDPDAADYLLTPPSDLSIKCSERRKESKDRHISSASITPQDGASNDETDYGRPCFKHQPLSSSSNNMSSSLSTNHNSASQIHQSSTSLESHNSPTQTNQNSPLRTNHKARSLINHNSPLLPNQYSPTLANQNSPVRINHCSPVLTNGNKVQNGRRSRQRVVTAALSVSSSSLSSSEFLSVSSASISDAAHRDNHSMTSGCDSSVVSNSTVNISELSKGNGERRQPIGQMPSSHQTRQQQQRRHREHLNRTDLPPYQEHISSKPVVPSSVLSPSTNETVAKSLMVEVNSPAKSTRRRDPSLPRYLDQQQQQHTDLSRDRVDAFNQKRFESEMALQRSTDRTPECNRRPQSAKQRHLRNNTLTITDLPIFGEQKISSSHVTNLANSSEEEIQMWKWKQWEEETRRRNADRAEKQTLV